MIRIGIDATAIPADRTGAGNYILRLVQSLAELEHDLQLIVFAKPADVPDLSYRARTEVIPVAHRSRIQRILWEQFALPHRIKSLSIDLLHSPHYTMPMNAESASVVTFHDMTFFLYPEMHQFYKRIFFRSMIRIAMKRADAIIAVSESSRNDILRILKANPDKVFAVREGVTTNYRPIPDTLVLERIRRKYILPEKFILYVGVLEPRKNLSILVQAFKTLVERGLQHFLVIVGRKGWMYKRLFQIIKELDLSQRVIFTGYVPEEELPLLYNSADLFAYPSLYEGFGLPVLEAMACGVPVITSNTSSMPEIAGDAGLLVDPHNTDEWADAMHRVLTDRALHAKLAQRGLERSKLFSWERTARETLAVYEHVV